MAMNSPLPAHLNAVGRCRVGVDQGVSSHYKRRGSLFMPGPMLVIAGQRRRRFSSDARSGGGTSSPLSFSTFGGRFFPAGPSLLPGEMGAGQVPCFMQQILDDRDLRISTQQTSTPRILPAPARHPPLNRRA